MTAKCSLPCLDFGFYISTPGAKPQVVVSRCYSFQGLTNFVTFEVTVFVNCHSPQCRGDIHHKHTQLFLCCPGHAANQKLRHHPNGRSLCTSHTGVGSWSYHSTVPQALKVGVSSKSVYPFRFEPVFVRLDLVFQLVCGHPLLVLTGDNF